VTITEQRIHLEYIPTKDMLANLLTKSLPRAQYEQLSKVSVYPSIHYLCSACSKGVCWKYVRRPEYWFHFILLLVSVIEHDIPVRIARIEFARSRTQSLFADRSPGL